MSDDMQAAELSEEDAAPEAASGELALADDEPSAAPPPGAAELDPAAEDVEYEYVYEDEDGNPIEVPHGQLDPGAYEEEVIQVIEQPVDDDHPAVDATAATVNIPLAERETRRTRSGSTRRMSDRRGGSRRRSGRQSTRVSGRLDPTQMKYAKLKTILMLGSIAMIPVLIVAILVMCWYKGYWPFRPRKVKKVFVQNDYERGRDLASKAWRAFDKAKKTLQSDDDAYYSVLQQCERNYNESVRLMQKWRDQHREEGYWFVDQRIQDANIKLREIREQKFKIEMRRMRK